MDEYKNSIKKAKELFDKSSYDEAIEILNLAINLNPYNFEGYIHRANCYYRLKNYDKASFDFNRSLELNSNNSLAYKYLGIIAYEQKQFNKSINYYNKALEYNQNDIDIFFNRGIAKSQNNQIIEAIKDFDNCIESNNHDTKAFANRGLLYFKLEEYDKALSDFNNVLDKDKKDYFILYNRGLVYYKQNKDDLAQADFIESLSLKPGFFINYFYLTIISYDKNENLNVIKYGEKYLKEEPEDTRILFLIIKAYYRSGNYLKTIDCIDKLLKIAPDKSELKYYRAMSNFYLENFQQSALDFEEYLKIVPESIDAMRYLYLSYFEIESYDKGIPILEKIMSKVNNLMDYLNLAHYYYIVKKDFLKAKHFYKEIIELFPNEIGKDKEYSLCLFRISVGYGIENNFTQELNYLNQLIDSVSTDDSFYDMAIYNRAISYYLQEKYDLALADFENVIKKDSTAEKSFYYIIRCLYNLNKDDFFTKIEDYYQNFSNRVALYEYLIDFYRDIGREDLADTTILKLKSTNIDEPQFYKSRGLYNIRSKEYDLAIKDFEKCIEYDCENIDYNWYLADCYLDTNQPERALEYYNKCIARLNSNSLLFYNRGCAFYDLKNYKMAIDDFSTALKLKKDRQTSDILYNRAISYYALKKYFNAVQDFEKIQNPDKALYFLYYGISLYRLDRYQEAIDIFSKGLSIPKLEKTIHRDLLKYRSKAIESQSSNDSTKLELNYYEVMNNFYAENLQDSTLEFEDFLMIAPDNSEAMRYLYLKYFEIKSYANGIKILEKIIAEKPNQIDYINLADYYFSIKKDYIKSKQLYLEITKIFADEIIKSDEYPTFLYRISIGYGIENNLQEELNYLNKLIEMVSKNDSIFHKAIYNRGLCYFKQQMYDLALIDFGNTCQLDEVKEKSIFYIIRCIYNISKDDYISKIEKYFINFTDKVTLCINLINFYREIDRADLAENTLNILKSLSLANSQLYYSRGLYYINQKKFDLAIDDLKTCIELDESNLEYNLSLADCYINTNKPDIALEIYNKCIALSPLTARILLKRGCTLINLENYKMAIDDFSSALILNTDELNPEIFYYRALSYYRLKRYINAVQDFEKIESSDKESYFLYYGICLFHIDRYQDAIDILSKGLKMPQLEKSIHRDLLQYRAKAYEKINSNDLANLDLNAMQSIN